MFNLLFSNSAILPLQDLVALDLLSCYPLLSFLSSASPLQHREDHLPPPSSCLCVFVCHLTRFRSKSNQPRRRHVSLCSLLVCPLSVCVSAPIRQRLICAAAKLLDWVKTLSRCWRKHQMCAVSSKHTMQSSCFETRVVLMCLFIWCNYFRWPDCSAIYLAFKLICK